FDTPERRAALEARLSALCAAIGDESVRKYYRQDLGERLRALFRPPVKPEPFNRGTRLPPARGPGRAGERGRQPSPREALRTMGARLGVSPLVRGFRSALPPREALILLTVTNHPWLMERCAEELAELEFRPPDAARLRRAILDAAGHGSLDAATLAAALAARELGPVLARVAATLTHPSDWPARADAASEDVERWWVHVVTLHRKSRTLHRELKEAGRALGAEPSEENLAWLRDVQERLAALDGTEAEIEGFGASSGRSARTL